MNDPSKLPTVPDLKEILTDDESSLISEDRSTNYKSVDSSGSSTYAKLPTKTTNMSNTLKKVNIEVLLKVIPEYNGYNIPLSTFLEGLEEAFAMVSEAQKPTLTRLVRSRLTGEALKAIIGEKFDTLDKLKTYLKDYFAPSVSAHKLRGDMAAEFQRENEGVVKFANRIKNLVRRIAEVEGISEDTHKDAAAALGFAASECFRQGLKSEIETQMEEAEGIDDLVKNAIAAERRIENKRKLRGESLAKQVSHLNLKEVVICQICKETDHSADKCKLRLLTCTICNASGHATNNCPNTATEVCQLCHRMGHIAKQCDKNRPPICQICDKSGHLATECDLRAQKPAQQQFTCGRCGRPGHKSEKCRTDISKKCDHCNRLGHTINECRTLQKLNMQQKNENGHLSFRASQETQATTSQPQSDLRLNPSK
ncbi:hypothetical protein TKK_0016590 [Trichogramma kaykai]|uniref:CCHC-type domain-containing protein n=1 Tax=Trichogramma kaykai TaxID=54128 RepID=A0ABD2W6P1_9HYME